MSDAAEFDDFEREFEDMAKRSEFLELVADGTPEILAAYQVGWTRKKLRLYMQDPVWREMVEFANDQMLDSVEKAMVQAAKKGNLGAMQMVLYNRRPDRWRDLRRIEVKQDVTVTTVEVNAAKQAALELLREHGIASLQPGNQLDFIDAESEEVEHE